MNPSASWLQAGWKGGECLEALGQGGASGAGCKPAGIPRFTQGRASKNCVATSSSTPHSYIQTPAHLMGWYLTHISTLPPAAVLATAAATAAGCAVADPAAAACAACAACMQATRTASLAPAGAASTA